MLSHAHLQSVVIIGAIVRRQQELLRVQRHPTLLFLVTWVGECLDYLLRTIYLIMPTTPSQSVRVAVAESLIRDLCRVIQWCDLWGIELNASKTMTMIVSRARSMLPQSPPLTIGGTLLKELMTLIDWV